MEMRMGAFMWTPRGLCRLCTKKLLNDDLVYDNIAARTGTGTDADADGALTNAAARTPLKAAEQ
jgi:hypothetical protein